MRKLLASILLLGGALALPALASDQPVNLEGLNITAENINGVVELPIKGMNAVDHDGQIVFISDNGRFVLTGQMYDIWYGSFIDSMAEIKDIGSRIDLARMGLKPEALNTVSFGTGKKEVVMFTDPLCGYCHALSHDLKALSKEYTVHLIVIPALGEESNRLAQRVACAKDEDEARDALLNGTLETLPTQEKCDLSVYKKTLVAAELIDVNGVPFVIADDGRVSRGRPGNLKAWLKGDA